MELADLQNKQNSELLQDDFVTNPDPINIDKYIRGRVDVEDTGAGVFGALQHIDMSGLAIKSKKPEDVFGDPDWNQDDSDQPPAWSIDRDTLDSELEMELKTTPFETYELTRGQVNGLFGSTLKVVGKLKGLVRIIENKDEPPLLSKELMEQLLSPEKYKIRLYVTRGISLAAMDVDIMGRPANSDPYLKAR